MYYGEACALLGATSMYIWFTHLFSFEVAIRQRIEQYVCFPFGLHLQKYKKISITARKMIFS